MKNCFVRVCLLLVALTGNWVWALGVGAGQEAGKRPMTFADLMKMRRVSDPQVSPGGRWVLFSVVDVDLEKNSKVSHLWVAPLNGAGDSQNSGGKGEPMSQNRDMGHPASGERQVTFWKEGQTNGRFSPDGKQVSFIAADSTTGLSQIFLASWDEATGTVGAPARLTNASTEADGAIWSPDGKRLLFTSRVYPECSNEGSWLAEDGCNKNKDAAAAANPVKAQIWDHLLYRHWDHYIGEKRSHILVVSATDGSAVRDLTPKRIVGDAEVPTFSLGGPLGYAWAPDSKEIAFVTNFELVPAASTNNDVVTLRLDDPGAELVKVSTSMGSDDGPAYSPDGRYLAFRSQARAGYESDRFRLMLFDRQVKTTKELLPKFDRWVDEFVWAPDSKTIYFACGDVGQEPVFRVGLDSAKVDRLDAGEIGPSMSLGFWAEFIELSIGGNGQSIFAVGMSVWQPGEIYKLNLNEIEYTKSPTPEENARLMNKGGHTAEVDREILIDAQPISHLNDPIVANLDLNRRDMERFWFEGASGTQVQGFIIRPPNFDPSRKYPVKFLIHGGPQGAWGDSWSYRWNPELMAADGYVVVMVNPRGSTGYGQAFIDGVNGDWGGKPYVDLMRGLDYAEQHYPFIDKARECALGASYGGYMANWVLTHTDRFACIVTHDGMYNPESAYGGTEELWFNEWEFRRQGDAEPGQPWRYAAGPMANDPFRKWSPMLAIQNAKTPTLVIHGQKDYRLDVSEGLQLFTALQRMGVPSRMLYFPDEGHWVLKPQNSKLWHETVADWCDRWTKTNAYAVAVVSPVPAAPVRATKPQTQPKPVVPVVPAPRITAPAPVAVPKAAANTSAAEIAPAPTTVPSLTQSASGSGSFSIMLSARDNEVAVGSDAQLTITLKNTSDKQVLFAHRPGRDNPEFSYRVEVRNAAGRAVEATAYGREAQQHGENENRTVDYVQPGGTSVQTMHLAKLVSLTKAGRYTVQVSRKDNATGAVVRSNELTLNVVP